MPLQFELAYKLRESSWYNLLKKNSIFGFLCNFLAGNLIWRTFFVVEAVLND